MTELDELMEKNQKIDKDVKDTNEAIAKCDNKIETTIDFHVNIKKSISEIDREFSEITQLNKVDVSFLILALLMQCLRQYLIRNDSFRISAKEGDKIKDDVVNKVTGNKYVKDKRFPGSEKTWKEIGQILAAPVPYDVIQKTDQVKKIDDTLKLSGKNHRYRTLGHDPFAGLIFGTANILTNSLTKTNFITTYTVENSKMTSVYQAGTVGMLKDSIEIFRSDKYMVLGALARQIIHMGSDVFTEQGLPIPAIATVNNDAAKWLITKCSLDTYAATRGAALAALVNFIIAGIHSFLYNEDSGMTRRLYEVKTKRIIMLSDLLSSVGNAVYVSTGVALGNAAALKSLDLAAMCTTLRGLKTKSDFINDVKREFITDGLQQKWKEIQNSWR